MSIADLDNVGGDNVADLYNIAEAPRTAHCFLCAQRLDLDRIPVYWEAGERSVQQILLHADCAQKLALRLVEDGHEAGLIERGRSIYVGVVPFLRPVEIPQARLVGIRGEHEATEPKQRMLLFALRSLAASIPAREPGMTQQSDPRPAAVLRLIAFMWQQDAYIRYIPPRGSEKPEWVGLGERLTEAVLDHANPCRGTL